MVSEDAEREGANESLAAIVAAIIGNLLIAVTKFRARRDHAEQRSDKLYGIARRLSRDRRACSLLCRRLSRARVRHALFRRHRFHRHWNTALHGSAFARARIQKPVDR